MKRRNAKATLAMKAAWRMARQGQRIFGGHVRQYIREALRIAWAEVKADPVVHEADRIIAELRARRGQPAPPAPTPYLARFMGRRPQRRVWGSAYL